MFIHRASIDYKWGLPIVEPLKNRRSFYWDKRNEKVIVRDDRAQRQSKSFLIAIINDETQIGLAIGPHLSTNCYFSNNCAIISLTYRRYKKLLS